MSSYTIIELRLNLPLEWSTTSRRVSNPGFGTAWMGGLYIPRSRSAPNEGKNLPAAVILNSSGWLLTIFILILSSSAAAGGPGSGFTINEYKAVGPTLSSPCSQRNSQAHFSLSPLTLNSSHLLCWAISFNMPIFATPGAYMLILAPRGFASAFFFSHCCGVSKVPYSSRLGWRTGEYIQRLTGCYLWYCPQQLCCRGVESQET